MHAYAISRPACRRLLGCLVSGHLLLLGLCPPSQAQSTPHTHTGQLHTGAACHGFVVLPNGFAVLSGQPATPLPGHAHAGTKQTTTPAGSPMAEQGHQAGGTSPHLLGYTHGQVIVPSQDMLCVPLGKAETHTWTTTGTHDAPTVTVTSLQGPLTRSNRTKASFALAVQQGGKSLEAAQVRVLARMPHHDRRLQGGHGPANDPDVRGLAVRPDGQGRYTIPLVDFTMAGPWLFEIQVQHDATVQKVYVAPDLSED